MRILQNLHTWIASLHIVIYLSTSLLAQCDRKLMVDDYQRYFTGTQISSIDLDWSGKPESCQAGIVSVDARQKTLARINYYRRLVKLPTEVEFDSSLTAMCQQAALMMHSNNQLSHEPEDSWTCFSSDGKKAAGKSNLALGAHSSDAIALYMVDPGANNGAVGHRRWILYSRAKDFGMGTTNRAHALYVIHNRIPPPEGLSYIAYPSEGYFPAPLLPERWSLSVPGGNFENAIVRMTDSEGRDMDFEIQPVKNGFGDNTLVWELPPNLISRFSQYDQTFDVMVSNILINQQPTDIGYSVTIAPVTHPPSCRDGFFWSEADCDCKNDLTTSSPEFPGIEDVFIYPNPADDLIVIRLSGQFANQKGYITLSDISGRQILNTKLNQDNRLEISHLPAGLYYVQLQFNGYTQHNKLVIKH